MTGFRILLAMMVYAGEMTDSEADLVYENLRYAPLPDKPSDVLPTVRAELERVRQAKQKALDKGEVG